MIIKFAGHKECYLEVMQEFSNTPGPDCDFEISFFHNSPLHSKACNDRRLSHMVMVEEETHDPKSSKF